MYYPTTLFCTVLIHDGLMVQNVIIDDTQCNNYIISSYELYWHNYGMILFAISYVGMDNNFNVCILIVNLTVFFGCMHSHAQPCTAS